MSLGLLYNYFNSKDERQKMRDESQAPRNNRELAVRNQFFTPRYVVEFLVDNTLAGIDHQDHHIGILDGLQALHDAVLLDGLADPRAPPGAEADPRRRERARIIAAEIAGAGPFRPLEAILERCRAALARA